MIIMMMIIMIRSGSSINVTNNDDQYEHQLRILETTENEGKE